MTDLSYTAVFVFGFTAGGLVFWQVSKYLERFRRVRRDLRATKNGIKTLVKMVIHNGVEAAKWAAMGGLAVAAVIALVVRGT
jgi:hypothetical protein